MFLKEREGRERRERRERQREGANVRETGERVWQEVCGRKNQLSEAKRRDAEKFGFLRNRF
jgi:hypothetical protein